METAALWGLVALLLLQSVATVGFLSYIHENQRTIRGDYGTPYDAQMKFGLPPGGKFSN